MRNWLSDIREAGRKGWAEAKRTWRLRRSLRLMQKPWKKPAVTVMRCNLPDVRDRDTRETAMPGRAALTPERREEIYQAAKQMQLPAGCQIDDVPV